MEKAGYPRVFSAALVGAASTIGPVIPPSIPFVIFGIFRYLLLMHRYDVGEEPEQVLLSDVPILLAVAGWIATAVAVLVLT
jgi:hypothetical protein